LLELLRELRQPLRPWQRLFTKRAHGSPRLAETLPRQATGSLEGGRDFRIAGPLRGQHASTFELNTQRRQRMCQHVVNLARQTGSLVERRRPNPRVPAGYHLLQQLLRASLLGTQPPQRIRAQIAEEKSGNDGDGSGARKRMCA
jgi:hypothetical protein